MKFKIKNKTTIEACTNESVEELSKYKKDNLEKQILLMGERNRKSTKTHEHATSI